MSMVLYQYASCDSCRKAASWLKKRGVAFSAVDIVGSPPTAVLLENYWRRSGLPIQSLFNVSGESYRKGGFKDRLPGMTNAQKLAALAADGKLIKRPLLVIETKGAEAAVLVGFKEEVWDATFAGLTL